MAQSDAAKTLIAPVFAANSVHEPVHDSPHFPAIYRYAKTKDIIQPEPRKKPEINRLYEELIARSRVGRMARVAVLPEVPAAGHLGAD